MHTKQIEWNDSLSTEVRSIDEHHITLIGHFNSFVSALEQGEPMSVLLKLYGDILEEVLSHFAFEEQIMLNIGYQGYNEHKTHHNNLLNDAQLILSELEEAECAEDAIASVNFLRHMIMKHISEQDLKIRDFVLRGIKS